MIVRVIGTPTEETWPGVSTLPEYKPFSIYQPTLSLIHFVPKLNNKGKDLLLVSINLSKLIHLSIRTLYFDMISRNSIMKKNVLLIQLDNLNI